MHVKCQLLTTYVTVQVVSLTSILPNAEKKALIFFFVRFVFQNVEEEMLPNGEATLNNHQDEGNANAGAETDQFGIQVVLSANQLYC